MQVDILINGAGLAGASLAVALAGSRYRIALVDSRPPPPPLAGWDQRIYALSPASRRYLEEIGTWQHLDAARIAPVYDMKIYGDRGARLDFSAFAAGVGELAWIVEAGLVQRELWETVRRQSNVTLLCPAHADSLHLDAQAARLRLVDGRVVEAALVVGADGVDSWVRRQAGIADTRQPYGEAGLVANFSCGLSHGNTAFQWFRADGVLAYLPLPGDAVSIVWSAPQAKADALLALQPEALAEAVAAAGGHRLGRLSPLTAAAAFPLQLMRPTRTIGHRVALIGDAAHAIHPLSGHGINLGFQDARALATTLLALPDYRDIGLVHELRPFERARAEEVLALQTVTHALNRLFKPQHPALAALRNFGLELTNHLPLLRNMLVRYALG